MHNNKPDIDITPDAFKDLICAMENAISAGNRRIAERVERARRAKGLKTPLRVSISIYGVPEPPMLYVDNMGNTRTLEEVD